MSPIRRRVAAAAAALVFVCAGAGVPAAQAPGGGAAAPTFEVAAVRENKADDGRVMIGIQPGGRFTATNVALLDLIRQAYGLQRTQIVGAPGWIETARFDIVAKAEAEFPPRPPGAEPGPLNFMLQDLLADRFKLRARRETREMPIYALTLARGDGRLGPGLRPAAVDCAAMRGRGARGGAPPAPGERPQCGMRMAPGQIVSGGSSMVQLAQVLSVSSERIVVDRTGLAGAYDIDLTFTPDRLPQGPPPPGVPLPSIDPNGPSLFTAVQEQLGLKLESERAPVEVLVIDHVERPTPD